MELKKNSKRKLKIFSSNKNSLYYLLFYSIVIFILGIFFYRQGYVGKIKQVVRDFKHEYSITALKNKAGSFNTEVDKLIIDISYENYQKLAFQRDLALNYGGAFLTNELNEGWVSCLIKFHGKEIKSKIKLKGRMPDHFGDTFKWSFKIKLKGNGRIHHMKRFAIQPPATRGYLNELILHKFLEFNNLIYLNYYFVNVIVNGKDYGIYMMEENMDKYVMEHNELREGIIFSLNTDEAWNNDLSYIGDAFRTGNIEYDINTVEQSENLFNQFNTAKNLFESFRLEVLNTSEVFDVKKLALFFSILDLFGNKHASYLDNLKLYYNPVSSLIEPICYDNQYIYLLSEDKIEHDRNNKGKLLGEYKFLNIDESFNTMDNKKLNWHESIFMDTIFFKEYIKALAKVSKEAYVNTFLESIYSEINNDVKILHKSFPYYSFEKEIEIIKQNAQFIRHFLEPKKCLNAYYNAYNEKENSIEITIDNISSIPLLINELLIKNEIIVNGKKVVDSLFIKSTNYSIVQTEDNLNHEIIEFILPDDFSWNESLKFKLSIYYSIYGYPKRKIGCSVLPFTLIDYDFSAKDFMRIKSNIDLFDFIKVDEVNKKIVFLSQKITVNKNIIIPDGFTVVAQNGLEIDFRKNAKIISYSNMKFFGTIKKPILVYSSDSTGQGILIINAIQKSFFRNVNFSNLSNLAESEWELTGAVNFYKSDIDFHNCLFQNNIKGDDFLNIISSKFNIDNCRFLNIYADAFDGDFVDGTIQNTTFNNIGNDAIDVSGSNIFISDVSISNAQDKGISGGENSILNIQKIQILDSELAIVSKDLSEIKVNDIAITSSRVGFIVFQKKPEFGSATIKISGLKMEDIKIPYLIEKSSTIFLEKEEVKSTKEKNVSDMLYGAEYGKKSAK
jgi:hypothetical protein